MTFFFLLKNMNYFGIEGHTLVTFNQRHDDEGKNFPLKRVPEPKKFEKPATENGQLL